MNTDVQRYGPAHRALRARLASIVALGRTPCSRCGGLIAAGAPWDLDHTDDGASYLGPAHQDCNRRAAARKVNLRRRARSRRW